MQLDKSAGSHWGLLGGPLRGGGLQGAPGAPEDLNYMEEGRSSGGRGREGGGASYEGRGHEGHLEC